MSAHQDKVLEHARRELETAPATDPPHLLPLYQKFLKIENYRLRLRHQAGGGGREVCASRASLIDVLLRQVFASASAAAKAKNGDKVIPVSLVALGGYGRGELNPGSDVDVMFLHPHIGKKVPDSLAQTVEQVLYFLWDVGFKVGHSTRSLREALAQANDEMLTKTAMLEARHLAGDRDLYQRFRTQFRSHCVQGHEKEYIAARMEDQARRHEKFANNVYLQEPNVKRGCGGLRDYQNLLWITYFKEGALTTTHLEGKDWLSTGDRRRIDVAYDFLLRVRTQLHYTNERTTDTLHLSLQPEIARRLGYHQKTPVGRNEAFMKDYYEHTRNIFRITERLSERFATGTATTTRRLFFPLLPRRRAEEEHFDNFFSRGGQLHVSDPQHFARNPVELMKAFEHAQERKLELSPELTDALSRRLRLVTREFRYARAPREIFARILTRKGEVARVLRMMHEVDFLGRYLPEFGHLTCLVQHEYFHRYTADEHTLVCLDKLDALLETEEPKLQPYRQLFKELADPYVLYLALLLHDTGKGVGARPHSEASALFAQAVAARLQLAPEQRRSLVLLVDHHVTLSSMAQQRNVDDPATVIELANIVKSQSNLDALMLLTLADGQGTTDNWSDWKESLVWHLYQAAAGYLRDEEGFIAQGKRERERLHQAVAEKLPPDFADEIEAHFDYMPDNYFRAFGSGEIVAHLELFRTLWGNIYLRDEPAYAPALRWEAMPEQGHSLVSICTWDRQHLLASIAGAFAVASLNILSADIFIRDDNLVLDVFRVRNARLGAVTDRDEIATVESTLRTALQSERFDFAPLLAEVRRPRAPRTPEIDFPTRISIENKSHPTCTLIQVETPDRLGLLYDLVACLGRNNVYITLSRISTEKGAAIDTFYVTDATTRGKITDTSRVGQLQEQLQAATMTSA
ncbi:MAG TPA: [protein-PII] uridylyltransferase [Chthoniobacterales bacterium]|nr:[protein-PII] uridylyltransferase [Chthoniobacterales bacterium]